PPPGPRRPEGSTSRLVSFLPSPHRAHEKDEPPVRCRTLRGYVASTRSSTSEFPQRPPGWPPPPSAAVRRLHRLCDLDPHAVVIGQDDRPARVIGPAGGQQEVLACRPGQVPETA